MKKYKVELIVTAEDILDDWTTEDFEHSFKDEIEFDTYGQIRVEEAKVVEVAE